MKTLISILIFAASTLPNCVYAEAYKCIKDGRPVYQGTPCEMNSEKGKLGIKEQTPEQKAMALEKLQEIRNQYDASATKQKDTNSAANGASKQTLGPQSRQAPLSQEPTSPDSTDN
ncbi:MAG: hypothetical protein PHH11_05095 [Methylomonas sp.]|nr:hypothetical protein [Methylomonas sp.]